MSFVVDNMNAIDAHMSEMVVDVRLFEWLSKVLKKEVVTRREWLNISACKRSDDAHVERAIESGEDVFEISFCDDIKNEFRHVVDWLAELEQRDARLFAKLHKITWKQAVEHSNRWHEALARKVAKTKNGSIEFDGNCPIVLECDDGLKWVWLKTDKARDDEGNVMGHCVGQGGYDALNGMESVFSLRDSNGKSKVTAHLKGVKLGQVVLKANRTVEKEYERHIFELYSRIGPRLTVNKDPRRPIMEDGIFEYVEGGDVLYHFENGVLHRDDGPAVIKENIYEEWWFKGNKHRENGPAVIMGNGDRAWWLNGKLHRIDGPAVVCVNGDREWWVNNERHREDGPAIERNYGLSVTNG